MNKIGLYNYNYTNTNTTKHLKVDPNIDSNRILIYKYFSIVCSFFSKIILTFLLKMFASSIQACKTGLYIEMMRNHTEMQY